MKSIKKTYTNRDEYRNENGELHREDGPALVYNDVHKEWWLNGGKHRVGGPAIVDGFNNEYWFLNGKEYSEEEYKIKLKKLKQQFLDIF